MTAATSAASTPSPTARRGRAISVLARRAVTRAVTIAHQGAASVVGVAGLGSIAVGAGMVYLPAGFVVGGVLAVWLASLLPGGRQ